ncbi:MAG: hypothetical protein EA379_12330 [Phycisphaerales bacterium]|nr:MAG: hypothetical protein EA379_12330 [Phycisphaerales bacterium]
MADPNGGYGANTGPVEPALNGARSTGLFQTRYREVTLSAIVFGVIVGAIMNAAITYAGLKIGFTIVGSAIAAVLGFGVLRGLLRRGSILEVNIGQTIASAVNTPNSGVIFTVPVLFLLGYSLGVETADFWLITLACMAGAILGGAFIIPLRKQMIDIDRLRFPSATGVAVILKSPGAGAAKALVLVAGIVLSMLLFAPAGLPALTYAANLDNLDRLVERERITKTDAVRTRIIASWIEQEQAPDWLVERGRALTELNRLRDERSENPKDEILRARVREADARVEALRALEAGLTVPPPPGMEHARPLEATGFNDDMARAAAQAAAGERTWDRLRSTRFGWAADRLPGYKDLQLRLSSEPLGADEVMPPGDESDLSLRVDRARDGNPDLWVTDNQINVGRRIGLPDQIELIFAIAPFALGAGFITGRAGLMVLAGGVLAYFILNPVVYAMGWVPETLRAHEAPDYAFFAFNRPLGIGLLLGGAMMGVLVSLPAIREAIKSVAMAGRTKGGSDELGIKVLVVAVLAALALLFVAADFVGNKPINTVCPLTEVKLVGDDAPGVIHTVSYKGYGLALAGDEALAQWEGFNGEQRDGVLDKMGVRPGWLAGLNPHLRALIIALVGAAWIWFAGIIIAQCTGMTDWSPISGMALLTVVLVMLLAGTGAVLGAVLIGAALCVAITCAADMMADLKTGYLVGSQPKRQQIVELIATGAGPLICMMTLLLIVSVNMKSVGIPIGPGTETVAPQAQALQAVITGVQGGEMPYALYGFGALLGALLGMGAFAGLGVLVGLSIYLPFYYIATYGIGCVINIAVTKVKGRRWSEEWGVPFAAGLIVGEAILALLINVTVLLRG